MTKDEHIKAAIRRLLASDQPVTVETVATRVSPEIARDLTDDDVVKAHAAVEGIELRAAPSSSRDEDGDPAELKFDPITGGAIAVAPKPLKKIEAPRAPQPRKSDIPPANSTTEAEALAAVVQAAQRAIADCRAVVQARTRDLQDARGVLHTRVREYMAGGEQHDEGAAYRATSQAERAERVRRFGTGVSASATRFVQKRMQHGPARGGLSEAGRARYGFVVPGSPAAMRSDSIGPDKLKGQQ
jgi:hypothetical protein